MYTKAKFISVLTTLSHFRGFRVLYHLIYGGLKRVNPRKSRIRFLLFITYWKFSTSQTSRQIVTFSQYPVLTNLWILKCLFNSASVSLIIAELGSIQKVRTHRTWTSTADGTCQCPCGLNLHWPRQVPSDLGKNSRETKLEMKPMKYSIIKQHSVRILYWILQIKENSIEKDSSGTEWLHGGICTFTTEMQKILRTAYQILTILYHFFSTSNHALFYGIIHFQIEDIKTR